MREKYNVIHELRKTSERLKGKDKLAMHGQGDFLGANNVMRSTMNIKHHVQHIAIDNPEFPFIYEGKENLAGKYSSFYTEADKDYVVYAIVKKYDGLLKGKCYNALYFLYCKADDSYKLVERKAVENLTENFGFDYNNEFLDNAEVGETIPRGTVMVASKSYDESGNVSIGVNGRILYVAHPNVQDDAIVVSESFAKRMISNSVNSITIPISDNTILLDLYGSDGNYKGLPDIGDVIHNGIVCATRTVKETRMFSDLRDASLKNINQQSDQVFYGNGEIVDINIYCNNPNIVSNKVNHQLVEYYNDARWFYTEVYKTCKKIVKTGSKNIDPEIHRWMRKAMNYLDRDAQWAFNDNVFSNMMIEILMRNKEPINIGRKIVGRAGNKTVTCAIWPDSEMPYLSDSIYKDENGRTHAKGPIEKVDLITNSLAIINRTIPMVLFEGSVTFILDRARKYAAKLDTLEEKKEFIFDILRRFHKKSTDDLEKVYEKLSPREKREFIEDCISLNPDGTLRTDNGMYVKWEAFDEKFCLRDIIIDILYKDYPDIMKPYHMFNPKPKWGRDIYLGTGNVGYQYIMLLKQSGEKGFSVRSAGAISDESLPEKSHDNKIGKLWHSEKPIEVMVA